jgi:hypothetical protein
MLSAAKKFLTATSSAAEAAYDIIRPL